MTHVIFDLCIRDGACAEVCPVDCIPGDPNHVESQDQLMAKFLKLTGK